MQNSADQGGCYPQRSKAEVDNILRDLQKSSYPMKAEFNNCFILKSLVDGGTCAGFYLGYLRGRSSPPQKKCQLPPQKTLLSLQFRVSNPTHVQLNWICDKDSRSFLHVQAFMRLEIRLAFFGIQNQSKEIEKKFNVPEV